MSRKILTGLALAAALALGSTLALAADPTLEQVYQAAQSGHLSDAQTMMTQVLRDHPGSAKAHFVEAELLAKQGRMAEARSELGTAEQLAPGLPFAKPTAVQELRQVLTVSSGRPGAVRAPQTGFPWSFALMGVLLAIAIGFFIRSLRRPQVVMQPVPGNGPYAGSYGGGGFGPAPVGGGYGPMPMGGGGMGSGILGGLATGAAVGAGMVAGEALMERVLGGGHSSPGSAPVIVQDDNLLNTQQYDMGGNDFGVTDAGAWDDNSGGDSFGVGGGDDWT